MFVGGPPCGPRSTGRGCETSLTTSDCRLLADLADCEKPASQDVQGRDRRKLPDTLAIARQAELDAIRDRPRDGEADDDRADWPTLLFSRARDTCRREAHVST